LIGGMGAAGVKIDEKAAPPAATAKLLPAAARRAWVRAFVSFACDELNGVYDRLSAAVAAKAPCPPDIRTRIDSIVRALSWSRDAVAAHVASLIEDGFERPEDAFAPAIVLLGLSPGDPKVEQWVAAQAAGIGAVIASLKR
jgi:hypothetical protein